jgi:hypothetical protein
VGWNAIPGWSPNAGRPAQIVVGVPISSAPGEAEAMDQFLAGTPAQAHLRASHTLRRAGGRSMGQLAGACPRAGHVASQASTSVLEAAT